MTMETTATAIDYQSDETANAARPRAWPAVALVAAFWAVHFALSMIDLPLFNRFLGMLFSTGLLMIIFLGWWSIDRRGRRGERLAGVMAWLIAGVAVGLLTIKSSNVMALILTAMPWAFTAWAAWIWIGRGLPVRTRKRGLVVVMALAWGVFALLRMDGLTGSGDMTMAWRWSKTPEELYLAELARRGGGTATTTATVSVTETTADWPGFRGPRRDGVVRGLAIATDWHAAPPKMLWKQRVGPGWSSMCVVGGRLYTQEQRGEVEAVVCRDAVSGAETWAHLEGARFSEAMAGPGPRATPTFAEGRIYAMTARGLLLCLDAVTGEKAWVRDVAAESAAPMPIWGFCASPLVSGGNVVVFAGGETKGVIAYDARTGAPAWSAPAGKVSYGSVQEGTVGDESQLLVWSDRGIVGMDPQTGAIRWDQAVGSASGMPRSLQPHTVNGAVLVAAEDDAGAARLDVSHDGGTWRPVQKWKTTQFRPSFNDFVVKGDYLYGLSGGALACVDLRDGKVKWRKGRYGGGQVLLLDDQSLLLVQCESGEVALVAAKPDGLQELARIPAIEGKTWNHPAVARGRLYVRNGEEMACFELTAK